MIRRFLRDLRLRLIGVWLAFRTLIRLPPPPQNIQPLRSTQKGRVVYLKNGMKAVHLKGASHWTVYKKDKTVWRRFKTTHGLQEFCRAKDLIPKKKGRLA